MYKRLDIDINARNRYIGQDYFNKQKNDPKNANQKELPQEWSMLSDKEKEVY